MRCIKTHWYQWLALVKFWYQWHDTHPSLLVQLDWHWLLVPENGSVCMALKATVQWCPGRSQTLDLWIACPMSFTHNNIMDVIYTETHSTATDNNECIIQKLPHCSLVSKQNNWYQYSNLWWNCLRWLNAYSWIPFTRWQHSNTVEKFINACQQVIAVTSFVSHVMKDLQGTQQAQTMQYYDVTRTVKIHTEWNSWKLVFLATRYPDLLNFGPPPKIRQKKCLSLIHIWRCRRRG